MECNNRDDDWESEVRRQISIEPTVVAMQRHLLFTIRSTSVRDLNSVPGHFHTVVDWDGVTWEGEGATAAEALGRVLLTMNAPGKTPLPTGFEERNV
jgi:hypothetical protein